MIVERRPFTELEAATVRALLGCKFPAGSPFKRVVKSLAIELDGKAARGLTEANAATLARIAWAHRTQLPAGIRPAMPPE